MTLLLLEPVLKHIFNFNISRVPLQRHLTYNKGSNNSQVLRKKMLVIFIMNLF